GPTDLCLACDCRLAASSAEMRCPAARLGLLFYRGGLERCVSRLGLQAAKRILLAAEKLDADRMLACGFLDAVSASREALREQVDCFSTDLPGMAPLALLGMKKHLNRIAAGVLDRGAIA